MAHPHVIAEAAEIQKLSRTARTEPQKPLKLAEVADVEQLPHIPLDVGLDVVCKPYARIQMPVVERRIAPVKHGLVERRRQQGCAAEFRCRQRQEIEQRHPAGQALRDPGEEPELLGAREHETARLPNLVNDALQPLEEPGAALHFIQNHPLVECLEKPRRIRLRELPLGWILETGVGVPGEDRPHQRCLARLPRTGDRHNGVAGGQRNEGFSSVTSNHSADCNRHSQSAETAIHSL